MRMKDEGFYTLIEMMGEFSEAGEPVPLRRRPLYPAELRDHTSKVTMQPHIATLLHTEEGVRLIRAMWYGGIIAQLWEKNKGLCAWQSSCTQAVKSLFPPRPTSTCDPPAGAFKNALTSRAVSPRTGFCGQTTAHKSRSSTRPTHPLHWPASRECLASFTVRDVSQAIRTQASLRRPPLPLHPCCAPVTIRLSPGG